MKDYIIEIQENIKLSNVEKIKEILLEGARAGNNHCKLILVYSNVEMTWADKLAYLEENFNEFKTGLKFKQFEQYLGLFSPYIMECCKDLKIDLDNLSKQTLVEWILLKKFNVKKKIVEEFWTKMEEDNYIKIVTSLMKMFEHVKI